MACPLTSGNRPEDVRERPKDSWNDSAEEIRAEESDEEFRQLINASCQKISFPPTSAKEQWEALDSKIVLQLDKLIGKSTLEHKLTTFAQKEQLETHLRKTYSDPNREIPLSEPAGLVWPAAYGEEFNSKPPSLKEINAVVQKARAKSAPGHIGVLYLLYTRCPNVLKWLHKILRGACSNLKISEQWMSADGVYVSKEQNSTEINQVRPISC
ncbi:hypothetical protein RRG08_016588 [Elysia crispata]|uniref:Uncharacterized protein n=1 Tax=Elysia crispata TaxID=231223 RepID=A0AAE1DQY6_9GAST|nr:hypothetical protein RRG08_016588 [Elysia crispata]